MLQVEEVAQNIVEAVQENQSLVVLPKVLGKAFALKRFVFFSYLKKKLIIIVYLTSTFLSACYVSLLEGRL